MKNAFVPSIGKKSSTDWTPETGAMAQQLSDLHLDRGAIRRTSMGGSMRVPAQPSLRDNNSSARHSTADTSYEDTSYEAAKPTFHHHYAKVTPAATDEDANLIARAAAAARSSGYSDRYIRDNDTHLRALSRELNSRGGLELDDEQLRVYVDAKYPPDKFYRLHKNYSAALIMLANHRKQQKQQPVRKRVVPVSLDDEVVINEASEYAVANGILSQVTADRYSSGLRRLSKALRSSNQTMRLEVTALRQFAGALGLDKGYVHGGLGMLESCRQAQRANNSQNAGGSFQPFPYVGERQLVIPQSQLGPSSGAAIAPYSNASGWQHGSQQSLEEELAAGLFAYPTNAYAAYSNPPQIDQSSYGSQQNSLFGPPLTPEFGLTQNDSPPPTPPERPWDNMGQSSYGSQQNWHFTPPLTPEFGLTQNDSPPPTPPERPWDNNPSFVPNPRWVLDNLPDLGNAVGPGWQHGRQMAPHDLYNDVVKRGLMPGWNSQTRFLINRELYTAELQSNGGVFLIHQFGAWLGDREWLYDQHIQRGFNLLRGELQTNYPDLAARTGLATPAMVQHLRNEPHTAFASMIRNQYGHDNAADFVFIPVSDAEGDEPNDEPDGGTHWSLLLLNRNDRNSPPEAYHFDSAGGYNSAAAEQVARRVGATTVIPMEMAQQQNGRDCGVFLLEAARTLIRQMAQGQPLNAGNLNPDRRALQALLRQHQGDNP
ncbi:Ulp1 family isopeptidase (plasmid) [Sinorhizobium meliloti]|nr:Ulp1 family isopeptidase [Sinorhizobium meliloti]